MGKKFKIGAKWSIYGHLLGKFSLNEWRNNQVKLRLKINSQIKLLSAKMSFETVSRFNALTVLFTFIS